MAISGKSLSRAAGLGTVVLEILARLPKELRSLLSAG
jgi:hypothetical protein